VIAANRSLQLTLVATNLLGQNTPAIAATEALYAEMWAQDATAMYGYAGAAAAATQVSAFDPAPEAADLGAGTRAVTAAESAAARTASAAPSRVSQMLSAVPRALQNLSPSPAQATSAVGDVGSGLGDLAKFLGDLAGPYSPLGHLANLGSGWLIAGQLVGLAQNPPGVAALLSGPAPVTGALGPLSGGYISFQSPLTAGATTVAATTGQASMVGSLSVPASWASAAPGGKVLPAALASSSVSSSASAFAVEGSSSAMFNEMALSSLAGRAVGGTAVQSVAGGAVRVIDKAPDAEALTTATILVIPVPEDHEG
jgi:PPE-repeat protein